MYNPALIICFIRGPTVCNLSSERHIQCGVNELGQVTRPNLGDRTQHENTHTINYACA